MTKAKAYFDASSLNDQALRDFDQMMIEAGFKVEKLAALADAIWGEVLEELSKRGQVRLMSGSFDDVGNTLIQRDYANV